MGAIEAVSEVKKEPVTACLVEGEAELVLDDLRPCQDGNVLQVAALALAEAGRLHSDQLRSEQGKERQSALCSVE